MSLFRFTGLSKSGIQSNTPKSLVRDTDFSLARTSVTSQELVF
jgi:hypothetical protein